MINSTQINMSSVVTAIIGPATTWANTLAPQGSPVKIYLTNNTSATNIFIGSSNMTTANLGVLVPPINVGTAPQQIPLEVTLYSGDALFGICLASTASLNVMVNGQQKSS